MPKLVRLGAADGVEITAAGLVVGRERGCDVVLRSTNVSRRHARLSLREGTVCVEDLDSHNGTRINDVPVKGIAELRTSDKVVFGDLTFTIIDDHHPGGAERPQSVEGHDSEPLPKVEKSPSKIVPSVAPVLAETRQTSVPAKQIVGEAVAQSEQPKSPSKKMRAKPDTASPPESEGRISPTFAACGGFLVLCLLGGFLSGRVASGLAAIELPGERAARENLLYREPPPSPAVDAGQDTFGSTNTDTRPLASAEGPQVTPESPQATSQNKTPQQVAIDQTPLPYSNQTRISVPTETPGEASAGETKDSAKTIMLLREINRAGIDISDTDAIQKIATEKLGMSVEQARRVMRLTNAIADRNALMEGRFNDRPKPKPAATTPATPVPRANTTPPAKRTTPKQATPKPVVPKQESPIPVVPTQDASIPESSIPDASMPDVPEQEVPNQDVPKQEVAKPIFAGSNPRPAVAVDSPAPVSAPVTMAVTRHPGFYINMWGLALVLGLLVAWLYAACWMGRDISQLGIKNPVWLKTSCLAGPAGAILALVCPDLGWGMMMDSACIGAPLLAYIAYRDERVPFQDRVLWFLPPPESGGTVDTRLEQVALPVELLPSDEGSASLEAARSFGFDEQPGVRAAKTLFIAALARRAAEIELELQGEEFRSSLRIDGTLRPEGDHPVETGRGLIKVIKEVCATDILKRRQPDDSRFRAKVGDVMLNVRTLSRGTSKGERLTLKLIRNSEELTNLAGLGCHRKMQGELRDIVTQKQGLFVVCGPDSSGKSTTVRASLAELDPSAVNIITIENPVECRIAGVKQIELNLKEKQTFSAAMKSVWCDDPNVVMVGEIGDQETATAVFQASQEYLILSAVEATDALNGLSRLLDMGSDPTVLADSLSAVLGQRLLRRLCPKCKVQYHPDSELLRRCRISTDHETVFFHPPDGESNCEACEGQGYRGRIGIFELLMIDDTIRALIRERATPAQIKSAARRRGMTTLRENGFRLAIRGLTSLDEVQAVTNVR